MKIGAEFKRVYITVSPAINKYIGGVRWWKLYANIMLNTFVVVF